MADVDGGQIAVDAVRIDPGDSTSLVADLPDDLADGVYVVRWRLLSDSDGHVTSGAVVFGVGEGADPASAAVGDGSALVAPEDVALRWLGFGALALLIGGMVVGLGLIEAPGVRRAARGPAIEAQRARLQQRALSAAASWGIVAFALGAGFFALEVRKVAGDETGGSEVSRALLFDTRWGVLWLGRQALLVLLVALVIRARRSAAARRGARRGAGTATTVLCALGAAALVTITALGGHAAGVGSARESAVAADAAHLAAASVWTGGLAMLVLLLVPVLRRRPSVAPPLARAVWRSFGATAAASVTVLVATGLYGMARQVASLDALLTTSYGRAMAGKVGLFAGMAALGTWTSARLHLPTAAIVRRALRRPAGWGPVAGASIRGLVLAEVAVGTAALLVAGLLTASPPAVGPSFAPASAAGPGSQSETAGDVLVTLTAQPNRPGNNVFTVHARSTRRPAPAPIAEVLVRFTFLDEDRPRETIALDADGNDVYSGSGAVLDTPGAWRAEVVARRTGLPDVEATFDWPVPAAFARDRVISDRPWGDVLRTMAVAVLALALGIAAGLAVGRHGHGRLSLRNRHRQRGRPSPPAWLDTPTRGRSSTTRTRDSV